MIASEGQNSRGWNTPRRIAIALTVTILLARLFAIPPLTDPTGAPLAPQMHLVTPLLYLIAAPVFTLWDGITMLSMSLLHDLLWGLAVLYFVSRLVVWLAAWRRSRKVRLLREIPLLAGALVLFALFLLAGALWHRPMVSLAGTGPDDMIVDFHSHTNVSHDVKGTLMSGFDAEANRRWHGRAGFDAAFITDHNTMAGWQAIPAARRLTRPLLCPGIELSVQAAHIVLLGDTAEIARAPYSGSLDSLLTLFGDASTRFGAIAIASIPEYELHYWGDLDRFVAAGIGGFEVSNAAPKANELSIVRRDSVIALARRSNLPILGVTDTHGWGATPQAWSLVSVPGWKGSRDPCGLLLARLRDGGFSAVQVVERPRVRPDDHLPRLLTPLSVIWNAWRSESWPATLSWLIWAWALSLCIERLHKSRPAAPAPR
ncbi:MAG: hypothetical protein ABJD11_03730 [Gemmatimonadota bacterium]